MSTFQFPRSPKNGNNLAGNLITFRKKKVLKFSLRQGFAMGLRVFKNNADVWSL